MDQLESTVERKSFRLLERAIHAGASDLHILPGYDEYTMLFRSHTDTVKAGRLPLLIGDRVITFFKFLSSLDISEKRKPQSGSFQHKFGEQFFSFRVSTLPSVYLKESLVIRLMLRDSAIPLPSLTYNSESAKVLQTLSSFKQGLLCFTGPTGSGKTTTLYSLTNYCVQHMRRHVISLEDPVENSQSHLLQIQVNEKSGVTYAAGLKAILRHSPDVIMIGEIRDSETAKAAVQAALTGHLVMTTVHSKDSIGCLYRLMDLGISAEELKQVMIGVAAQRIVQFRNMAGRADFASVYEILHDENLSNALTDILAGKTYRFPEVLTLEHQIREGILDGSILS